MIILVCVLGEELAVVFCRSCSVVDHLSLLVSWYDILATSITVQVYWTEL